MPALKFILDSIYNDTSLDFECKKLYTRKDIEKEINPNTKLTI